ncbi:unnamed protein product [Staurois parvus]|uniref:Uncharacterized protein n=1 Tax=Staurois parvus TaxID=386267 RepID=A0ABN9AD14_9NEOB|nr:unnamed protein product [Staurois parvus]
MERLILDNQCISCCEIAQEMNLSVGTVNTIADKVKQLSQDGSGVLTNLSMPKLSRH